MALLGERSLPHNANLDEINMLALGLTNPIPLDHESPVTCLTNDIQQRNDWKTKPLQFNGILSVAISYRHHQGGSKEKLSSEQAQKAIDKAWKLAKAFPYPVRSVRFWIDQKLPSRDDDCASSSQQQWVNMGILPYYRLPVVCVARKESIARSGWLTVESALARSCCTVVCENRVADINFGVNQVAAKVIAGLLDDKEFLCKEDYQCLVRWACSVFTNSQEMKKVYGIKADISDSLGFGYYMAADFYWRDFQSCKAKPEMKKISMATLLGMSSKTFDELDKKTRKEVLEIMAAYSLFTNDMYCCSFFPAADITVAAEFWEDGKEPRVHRSQVSHNQQYRAVYDDIQSTAAAKLGLGKKKRFWGKRPKYHLEREKYFIRYYLRAMMVPDHHHDDESIDYVLSDEEGQCRAMLVPDRHHHDKSIEYVLADKDGQKDPGASGNNENTSFTTIFVP